MSILNFRVKMEASHLILEFLSTGRQTPAHIQVAGPIFFKVLCAWDQNISREQNWFHSYGLNSSRTLQWGVESDTWLQPTSAGHGPVSNAIERAWNVRVRITRFSFYQAFPFLKSRLPLWKREAIVDLLFNASGRRNRKGRGHLLYKEQMLCLQNPHLHKTSPVFLSSPFANGQSPFWAGWLRE